MRNENPVPGLARINPTTRIFRSPSQYAFPIRDKGTHVVFEKSLLCTFSTLDEYLELFLTRVDGSRRRMASTGEEGLLEFQTIRQTFQVCYFARSLFDIFSIQTHNSHNAHELAVIL
ncbi:hypothetical protein QN277_011993 [Acacia crassicarpa]|uniref:Uncharacterized protein n=1 Tax=Acacia crassicarpa TaxID=499986 RepID=A0AAE1MZZ0_9FABA|nr:hypothetical protein QN277_011993 [Acacia crassicarpa]